MKKETKFCINCGKEISATAAFCPFCSAWQEDVLPKPAEIKNTSDEQEDDELTETIRVRKKTDLKSRNMAPVRHDDIEVVDENGVPVENAADSTNEAEIKELKDRTEELADKAYHDQLTKLYNRQKFTEVRDSIKENDICSFVSIDINDLKKTNDTYGHDAGDQLINNMAKVLRTLAPDESYRMGGDEFLILLRGANKDTAQKLAYRVRTMLDDLKKDPANGFVPVAAIGVAEKEAGEAFKNAYKRADDLMYEDKRKLKGGRPGRDEPVSASDKKDTERTIPDRTITEERHTEIADSIRKRQEEHAERAAKQNYMAKKSQAGRAIRSRLSTTIFFVVILILLMIMRINI